MDNWDIWVENEDSWVASLFADDVVSPDQSNTTECAVYYLKSIQFPEQTFVAIHQKTTNKNSPR